MQAQVDRDLPRRRIGDQHRHSEGIDPGWSSGGQLVVLFMHRVQPADSRAQHHGDPGRIDAGDGSGGHGPGLPRCQKSELGAAVGAA